MWVLIIQVHSTQTTWLSSLDKIGGLWKVKDDEKLMNVISNLLNGIAELKALATTHGLSNELYYGGGVQNSVIDG